MLPVEDNGMSWWEIAASSYRAYATSTGNKNFRGEPMPAFEDLPRAIQIAWEAAARQAGNCLLHPEFATKHEDTWAGWIPPDQCPNGSEVKS